MTGEEFNLVGQIFVKEAMRADADGKEQEGVEKLIASNKKKEAIVALACGAGKETGTGHDGANMAALLKG